MTPMELRAVLLERLPADTKWRAWVEGVVERVGTVEDPRIARITALCDEPIPDVNFEEDNYAAGRAHALADVAGLLGETQPTPPPTDLLDALKRVVDKAVPNGEDEWGFIQGYVMGTGAIHNAIKVLGDHGIPVKPAGFDVKMAPEPTPPHGIDRDALYELLWDWRAAWISGGTGDSTDQVVEAALALVRRSAPAVESVAEPQHEDEEAYPGEDRDRLQAEQPGWDLPDE